MALWVSLVLPASVTADTVVLSPSKDNTIYSESGSVSNGRGEHVFAGVNGHGAARRALIGFDLTTSIPSASTVQSARLKLHMSRTIGPIIAVSLHRLLSPWGEGDSRPLQDLEGGGAAARTGDATWLNTFFDTGFWSTPGGEFVAAPSATTMVNGEGFYTWGSTALLVSDIQSWLNAPTTNHGWIVSADNEGSPSTAKRFDSRKNPAPDFRPTLEITFTTGGTDAGIDAGVDEGQVDGGLSDGGSDAGTPNGVVPDSGQPASGSTPSESISLRGGSLCASTSVPAASVGTIALIWLALIRRARR